MYCFNTPTKPAQYPTARIPLTRVSTYPHLQDGHFRLRKSGYFTGIETPPTSNMDHREQDTIRADAEHRHSSYPDYFYLGL